jgi:hypothetical protein
MSANQGISDDLTRMHLDFIDRAFEELLKRQ